jgi:uncharacterized SAM-binding protein YcdF (DUF218 family)
MAPQLRRRPQGQQEEEHPSASAARATAGGTTGSAADAPSCRCRRSAFLLVAVVVLLPILIPFLTAFNSKLNPTDLFQPASSPPVDAAVVLGYALRRDGTPTAALSRRVKAGVALWRSRAAGGRLVFSGAAPSRQLAKESNRPTEAAVMARAALREVEGGFGGGGSASRPAPAPAAWRRKLLNLLLPPPLPDLLFPPSLADLSTEEKTSKNDERAEAALEARYLRAKGWRLERRATSTRENAERTLEIAKQEGWRSLAVVTSPWHARRALATFRRAAEGTGVKRVVVVLAAAADGAEEEGERGLLERLHEAFDASVRESAAAALYWARGWA